VDKREHHLKQAIAKASPPELNADARHDLAVLLLREGRQTRDLTAASLGLCSGATDNALWAAPDACWLGRPGRTRVHLGVANNFCKGEDKKPHLEAAVASSAETAIDLADARAELAGFQAEDPEGAIRNLRIALKSRGLKDAVSARRLLARFLHLEGDVDGAEAALRAVLEAEPSDPLSHRMLGWLLCAGRTLREAAQSGAGGHLRKGMEGLSIDAEYSGTGPTMAPLAPADATVHFALAVLQWAGGDEVGRQACFSAACRVEMRRVVACSSSAAWNSCSTFNLVERKMGDGIVRGFCLQSFGNIEISLL
jgi:hypothetical protein